MNKDFNTVDMYLVVCCAYSLLLMRFFKRQIAAQTIYTGTLMEYAVILLLFKRRKKPTQIIDQGLEHLLPQVMERPMFD